MKKLIVVLFALLILVGCSEKGYSQISNGNDVIFKGPNGDYTKGQLYETLKVASQASVETDILDKIASNLNLDLSDIEKEADDMLEMYKSMGYESYIQAYYGSEESFKQMYISSGTKMKLAEVYVEENFDSLINADKPVKMQMASFETEEAASKVVEAVNNGSTFEMAIAENGFEGECPAAVYIDSDSTPVDVKSYLNDTDKTGISTVITVTNSSSDNDGNISSINTYYVLNVISKDVADFKEDYIAKRASATSEDVVKQYLFMNHDIKFYDQDIYEMMTSAYEVLQ